MFADNLSAQWNFMPVGIVIICLPLLDLYLDFFLVEAKNSRQWSGLRDLPSQFVTNAVHEIIALNIIKERSGIFC